MEYHTHVTPNGSITCHSHEVDGRHVHEEADASLVGVNDADGSVHEHEFGSQMRIRHRHLTTHVDQHSHDGEVLQNVILLPPKPAGARKLFPSWIVPHPCYDIWPLHHIRPSHAKAHFNTSGVDDVWPGALTVLTQAFKIAIGILAWAYRNEDDDSFYRATLFSIAAVSLLLVSAWCYIWARQSMVNVILTLSNYILYTNGWTLSVIVLYDNLEATYRIPQQLALIPVLGPPAYITLRTLLFFPSPGRRQRFLLAALSNRSVPLELNFYVVGPHETWLSHGFLTMLNSYAMVSTLIAKAVVFSLQRPSTASLIAHCIHLLSVWWASLYAIRCRQIAVDCYKAAEIQAVRVSTSAADVVGKSS